MSVPLVAEFFNSDINMRADGLKIFGEASTGTFVKSTSVLRL